MIRKKKPFVVKALCGFVAASAWLSLSSASHAAAILNNRTDVPGGSALTMPGSFLQIFPNPLVVNYGAGQTATFTGPAASGLQRLTGNPGTGNFGVNQPIFSTNQTAGPLELVFSSDISSLGTQFQTSNPGAFTATIQAFDIGNNLIGTVSRNGVSDNNTGTAIFLGFTRTGSDAAIRRVLFSTTNDVPIPNVAFTGGFGVNPISFSANAAAVPEPGTMSLMALGLASLFAARRKKKTEDDTTEDA